MPQLPPLGKDFVRPEVSLRERLERFMRHLEQWRDLLRPIPNHFSGSGSPEGVVRAQRGDTYYRIDGGPGERLYVKTTTEGMTGWEAV